MANRNVPIKGSQPASTNVSSNGRSQRPAGGKLDLTDTIKDGARVVTDAELRRQLLMAFTEDSRLHVREAVPVEVALPELGPDRSESFGYIWIRHLKKLEVG